MELSAVANCTSRSLLPPEYVKKLEDGALHAELQALELMME